MPTASDASFSYAAELRRKALHLLALVLPLGMWVLGSPGSEYLLGGGAAIAVAADCTRAYVPAFNDWIRYIFGSMMRADELPAVGTGVTFNGATCVMVGAFLMTLLFPIRLAAPLLAMTMLADAAAALVGRRWGRHAWGALSATVEGTTAFVVTGLLVIWAVPGLPFLPATLAVITAAITEVLPLPINDNIRVPIAAGLVMVGAEALWMSPPPVP